MPFRIHGQAIALVNVDPFNGGRIGLLRGTLCEAPLIRTPHPIVLVRPPEACVLAHGQLKLPAWRCGGVDNVWIVHGPDRQFEVTDALFPQVVRRGDRAVAAGETLTMDLAALFADLGKDE